MAPSNPPSTCLFLPELPVDLTDTVLERHFRGFTGFESCRTRHDRNGKLVGFVEFEQVDDAIRCRDSMQGSSPFSGQAWHIHFSNSTQSRAATAAKRPREESGPPVERHVAPRQSYGAPMYAPSLRRCVRARVLCAPPLPWPCQRPLLLACCSPSVLT